jgi:hypothetical protein
MHRNNRITRGLRAGILVAATIIAFAQPVAAIEFGPRVGLTIDPDQVHGGMQFRVADLTPRVWFVPNFEIGAGDDIITVAGNMDFFYVFGRTMQRWRPYLGGGPGVFFYDFDEGDGETEVGLNLVGGFRTRLSSSAFFGEMRLGLIDAPDIRFTVGWMFR